jgi:prepilin peptidase CpaA
MSLATPMTPIAATALLLLGALLSAALTTDLRSRRIPNRLVLAGITLAAATHVGAMLWHQTSLSGPDWWSPLTGLLAGGALLAPLYLIRACGAGDVKLLAMVGAFIGVDAVLLAALYTLLAGGLLSLIVIALRGIGAQTFANVRYLLTDLLVRAQAGAAPRLAPLEITAARLPYAVAIATGTVMALVMPSSVFS